ncbi:DUF1173 domain-containing protein [Burkholderia cepacia]|uniref:DUF1173 domain-containing protein n=1 Tax=Burkholderia cepacia TaxID=292 RepID=UPI002ABDFC7C|nr:DUF1173 domain-containing protein [Burkholderia cepacia]
MDTSYLFDDVVVAGDGDDLQPYLKEFHGAKKRPLCRCLPAGVPMYIASFGDRHVIKRMPNTGAQHAPECESYEPPPELSGLGEVRGHAIQEDPESGNTILKLDFSLTKTGKRQSPSAGGTEADTVRTDGAKLTLRGMLHYLWDEAGLSRWSPAMAGRRSWYVVRKYLLQAALGKATKGELLGKNLFIPESYSSDHATEIAQRRLAQLADLATPGKVRKLMIAIGEVKEIGPSRYGYKLVAKHLPDFPFMVAEDLHKRIEKRFGTELMLWTNVEGAHLVFVATFGLTPSGYATLDSISLMATTANWIPIEHAYDRMLIDTLTAQRRRFVKGLRYNLAREKPLASAVLTDVDRPVGLYLNLASEEDEAVDGTPVQSVAELAADSELDSWIWDVWEPMPALPLPVSNRAPVRAAADDLEGPAF